MTEQRKVVVPSPENSETPLADAQSWVTPNRLFFVRNHFEAPHIDADDWRLSVGGCVQRELSFKYEQLKSFPQRSVFSTVECAGNGRSFLAEKVAGVQWGAGAVGHAEWSGVPLKFILQEAGLKDETQEIVFAAADVGTEPDHPEPMPFARSMPLDKAQHADTLLALRMNGEPLDPLHGFPVRLLVPGWYGVASVKWLTRIDAVAEPFRGYFQSVKYTVGRWTGRGHGEESIGAMPVKSEIVRPRDGETVGVGTTRIFGLAWAGEEAVEAVEVSIDGGESWRRAEIVGPRAAYSWVAWEYLWEVVTPGEHQLLSRAISENGQVQPIRHDRLRGGYLITFSRPTTVRVDPSRRSHALAGDAAALNQAMRDMAEERSRFRLDVEMEFAHGAGI
jgi:DMSO/TMAO reductase YedYZ molybdopterin-dependent catalytic subunit